MPRPSPPEFRQRALDLVRSGRPVPEVARLLGIAESCLYRWRRQDLVDRGLKPAAESAELAAARRKIRELQEENKILRKAAAAVQEVVPPKDRFRLVTELNADGVRVRQACFSMGVSTSGFYEWKSRAPSARSVRLWAHAGRARQPQEMAHADRAGQRDLRVHRGLPQPPTAPQRHRLGHPARVRNRTRSADRSSSKAVPENRGMIRGGSQARVLLI